MNDLDWREGCEPAAVVQSMAAHRLLPVAGLLAERGLLRPDLVPLAGTLARREFDSMRARGGIEDEVAVALVREGVRFLVLKGALLGRSVYSRPEARVRTDMDVLVPEEAVSAAQKKLRTLGFAPSWEVHGGPPMTQAQWIRPGDSPVHAVDLHWDLFNLPVLKHRFEFAALFGRSVPVPGMGDGVRGLSPADALLHACAHYFGHHQGEFRPDQWLLDMDLLWRAMDDTSRSETVRLAVEVGVASLVGAGLKRSIEVFETPVAEAVLDELVEQARAERSARLIRPPRFPKLAAVRNAFDERGPRAKLVHLWRLAFPPVAHMQRKYPGARWWALPWLYLKRMVR